MKIEKLQECIINTMCELDVTYLSKLDSDLIYSHQFKDEVIIEFAGVIKKLLLEGVRSLNMKKSECKFCYPNSSVFGFHHPETDKLVIRYVVDISDNKNYDFIIEECRNKPLKFEDVFPGIK